MMYELNRFPMASDNPNNYQAYLLRLWRDDGNTPWRASLQDTRAGQLHTFASLSQLIAFIEQQAGLEEEMSGRQESKE